MKWFDLRGSSHASLNQTFNHKGHEGKQNQKKFLVDWPESDCHIAYRCWNLWLKYSRFGFSLFHVLHITNGAESCFSRNLCYLFLPSHVPICGHLAKVCG